MNDFCANNIVCVLKVPLSYLALSMEKFRFFKPIFSFLSISFLSPLAVTRSSLP